MSTARQQWFFWGRQSDERVHDGAECYVWVCHPTEGVHPEADEFHHLVHWEPVATFWPVRQ